MTDPQTPDGSKVPVQTGSVEKIIPVLAIFVAVMVSQPLLDLYEGWGLGAWPLYLILVALLGLLIWQTRSLWPKIKKYLRRGSAQRFQVDGKLKRGYFSLRPYEEKDRRRFQRPDRAVEEVFEWIRTAEEPLLLLTGCSGAGKTSLLRASVVPRLGDVGCHTVYVRCQSDPSSALKQELLRKDFIWKNKPSKVLSRKPLLEILKSAAKRKDVEQILVVIDQFEELFVLLGQESTRHRFIELLRSLVDDPVDGLCILLVTRAGFLEKIQDLQLAGWEVSKNWFNLDLFNSLEARAFFEDSGLTIESAHLDALISEARQNEKSDDGISPFTLNLIGVALMKQDPRRLRSGTVLRDYLARALKNRELKQLARPILAGLIRGPKSRPFCLVEEVATREKVRASAVEISLQKLDHLGLVRKIDSHLRAWQITHSGLQNLIFSILEQGKKTWRQRVRPFLAVSSLILVLGSVSWVSSLLFFQEKHVEVTPNQAAGELIGMGFGVSSEGGGFVVRFKDSSAPDLEQAAVLLNHLDGTKVRLFLACREVDDLTPLGRVAAIQTLGLTGTKVEDLTPLHQLPSLQNLYLSRTAVRDLVPLGRVPSLKTLHLANTRVKSIAPLGRLSLLSELNIANTEVRDLAPLRRLLYLRKLDLSGADFVDFTALGDLNLESVDLSKTQISDLGPLAQISSLQELVLSDTPVDDLGPLGRLSNLRSLHIDGTSVVDLTPLSQLTSLENLYVSFPPKAELSQLSHLEDLEILPAPPK